MCTGSPWLGVIRRLCPTSPVRQSVRLSRTDGWLPTRPGTRARWFPRSLCFVCRSRSPAVSQQLRHGYAADLPHGLRVSFCKPHRSSLRNGKQRDALRPAHIHQVGAGAKVEGRKRRFLAYSSPSRSPDPRHLAVLTRPGFVRAAPTLPGVSRVRLRSAPTGLLRQPSEEVSHVLRSSAPHGAPAPRGANRNLGRAVRLTDPTTFSLRAVSEARSAVTSTGRADISTGPVLRSCRAACSSGRSPRGGCRRGSSSTCGAATAGPPRYSAMVSTAWRLVSLIHCA